PPRPYQPRPHFIQLFWSGPSARNLSLCARPRHPISWKEQQMKNRIILACLAAGVCLAVGFALTRANRAAPEDKPVKEKAVKEKAVKAEADKADGEEAAIRKAVAAYTAAYAKGDAAAVLALWTADAEFIDEDGKVFRGRDTLAPLYAKSLPSFKGYKITSKL